MIGGIALGQSTRLALALDADSIAGIEPGNSASDFRPIPRSTTDVIGADFAEANTGNRDADGWTIFTPSADTRVVYVSPTGTDSNDGLSPATAKRSIDEGMSLLRDGFPDWLLLEKGGTWDGERIDLEKSGRSADEPMLISTYGSGPRPILRTTGDGVANYRGGVQHVAVVGLELTAQAYDGSNGSPVGVFLLGWFNDVLLEDLYIHNYAGGLVFQNNVTDPADFIANVQVRRSVIERAYTTQSNHSQGLYAEGVDGLLLEECVFYRCGFDEGVPGSEPTIFRHTCYFQNQTRNITARGNITLETSSHGYQFRGSSTVAQDNFLARVGIGILVGSGDDPDLTPDGGASGLIENNVILYARDISPVHPRGIGLAAGNVQWGIVRGNVFAHSIVSHEVGATMSFGRSDQFGDVGINNFTIEGNVIYNWRAKLISSDDFVSTGTYTNVSFRNNQIQGFLTRFDSPWIISMDAPHAAEWTSAGNKFWDVNGSTEYFAIGSTRYGLSAWKNQVGDTTSVEEQLVYPDPDRNPERYVDHIEQLPPGTSLFDDFVGKVLAQSKDSWDPRYTAGAINDWIRSGFALNTEPIRPTTLLAATVSATQIDLTWIDNARNEDGFRVVRSQDQQTWSPIGSVGVDATGYADTGLSPFTLYYYRVLAYNVEGDSSYSNVVSAATIPPTPAEPSGLVANAVSSERINLVWTDNSDDEEGFHIIRSPFGEPIDLETTDESDDEHGFQVNRSPEDDLGIEMAEVGPGVTTYSDTGLEPETEYFYQVRAFNSGGGSAYSTAASASTLRAPPERPSSVVATAASSSEIDLTWIDQSDDEDGFRIERTSPGNPWAEVGTVAADVTGYTDTGLDPDSPYSYRIQAFRSDSSSIYSAVVSATTYPAPPVSPAGLGATAISTDRIDLAWTDNSADEDGFRIERSRNAASWAQVAAVDAGAVTYTDIGLDEHTRYYYRVQAFNLGGSSGYSNTASDTTLPTIPLAPSGLLATTASSTQIDLTWSNNAFNEEGIQLQRSIDGSSWALIDTVAASTSAYTDQGLSGATEYFYRARAFNVAGTSGYSNVDSATTPPGLPPSPTSLLATALSSSRIYLVWTDNTDDEDGFHVERSADGTSWAQIDAVGANVTAYADRALPAETEFFYRVRAFNASANSAYSNVASATTWAAPPADPSGLGATAVAVDQIDLAWTDNAANEDGFFVERSLDAMIWIQIDSVGANVNLYSDTGLNQQTEYFYRVRAFNATGSSAYSNVDSATTFLEVSELVNGDIPVSGTVTNAFDRTTVNDSLRQSIREERTDGLQTERISFLEHKWSISVTGGDFVTFFLDAFHDPSPDGDDFEFSYSTDDIVYTPMMTVTKTVDDDSYQSFALPASISGTVYIRVTDTDRTPGARDLDVVRIDHIYVRSVRN